MFDKEKSPQFMTSQELEAAIRQHREYAKRLLVEVKLRRAKEKQELKKTNVK